MWAPPAAKKAFLANRIGDVGFLLAMFLIFATTGSLDFDVVFGEAGALAAGTVTAIALLLFLACTGKSAQFPLYVWLPDAMAGPTPVSALIHAATMVTAGVFLVARTHTLFEASGTAQTVVVLVGAGTALLAALIAIGQDDIKKILAYSTVSQLGYMFIGVGAGADRLRRRHVPPGHPRLLQGPAVPRGRVGDARQRRGHRHQALRRPAPAMPITFWTTMAAWAAIIGVPLTAGFYSKDQVLAALFEHGGVGRLAWVVGVLTAGLTAFYMSRYVFLTFFGERRWPEGRHPHESPPSMTVPLIVLAVLALVAGFALTTFTGEGGRLQSFLEPVLGAPEEHESLAAAVGLSAVATGAGRGRGRRRLAAVHPAVRLAGPAPPLGRGLAAPGRRALRRPGLRVLHRQPGRGVRRLPGPQRRPARHRRRRQRRGRAGRRRRPLRPPPPVRPGPELRPRRARGRRADRRLPGVPAMTPSHLEPPPCC